jgi:predicted SAM-dependent methyltransferase
MKQIKLNLGCYDKQLPGFVNVDIRPECNPDVVDDAFKLETFKEGSVDLIYSSHLFEHLNYVQARDALSRWYDVLKPGGVLRIAVPDFDALAKRYAYTGNLREILHSVCGSQKHEFDFHYCVYDEQYLTELLTDAGFGETKRYDWAKTDPHNYVDDFSRAYLPSDKPDIALSHGRVIRQDGLLVSLNMEAVKD